jgi:nitrous oxidase accessory protein NosD
MSRLPLLLLFAACSADAAICTVPASHASIQSAIDDSNCSEIQMSPGQYDGSLNIARSLALIGSGSNSAVVRGVVSVSGNATQVTAQGFRISGGCLGSWLIASSGATLSGLDLVSELLAPTQCPGGEMIFEDGFETSP